MKRSRLGVIGLSAAIALVISGANLTVSPKRAQANGLRLTRLQNRILSGFAGYEFGQVSSGPGEAKDSTTPMNFFPSGDDGCPVSLGNNRKVNQNCLNIGDPNLQGRSQAQNETAAAADPSRPNHIVASYNDYRRGDGTCGTSYSVDGGQSWQDSTVPNGFTRGAAFGGVARQYWQAGGDTSVAWDTRGNAYLGCMTFMRGAAGVTNNPDQSSAIYVFRSTGNFGASWNFPGRPATQQYLPNTPSGLPLIDKPYMTVDNHVDSPFRDRVYVTWTVFAADGTANIYEAHSSDYGEHFGSPVRVTGKSDLCPNSVTTAGRCDANQFSDPFTGSDGSVYVAMANYNNAPSGAKDNHNQILLAKSTDGGNTFGSLVKASDFYDLPDCPTYQAGQNPGRPCVPEKGSAMNSVFRSGNYPAGAVDPANAKQVSVTVGSYINQHSNEANGCVPAGFAADLNLAYTGVKTAGACNNDILLSVSSDAGASFTGTKTDPRQLATVDQSADQATTDQFWQWAAYTNDGRFAVSYFDRQYGSDETTGSSDISLSVSRDLKTFGTKRITSSSMPLPTQFPNSHGNSVFYGDYSGLSAANDAIPVWMDTRSPDLFLCPGTATPGVPPTNCKAQEPNGLIANDQDIFAAAPGEE
jgi:hypothetical protein